MEFSKIQEWLLKTKDLIVATWTSAEYNIFEQVVIVVFGILIVYFLVAIINTLFRALFALKNLFIPKSRQIHPKSIKSEILPKRTLNRSNFSKNEEKVGLWSVFKNLNRARALSKIEKDMAKDKPLKVPLSTALFMIQNFKQYNYFSSEDGKVLFDKVKKDIEIEETKAVEQEKIEDSNMLSGQDMLKKILPANIEVRFNSDGNIVSFKDKNVEQQKLSAEFAKETNNELTFTKGQEQKQENDIYSAWLNQPQEEKIEIQKTAPKAKDLKRQIQKAKQEQKIDISNDFIDDLVEDTIDKLADMKPDEFYVDDILNDLDPNEQLKKEQKQQPKKNTKKDIIEKRKQQQKQNERTPKQQEENIADKLPQVDNDFISPAQQKQENILDTKSEENPSKQSQNFQSQQTKNIDFKIQVVGDSAFADKLKEFLESNVQKDDIENGMVLLDKQEGCILFSENFFARFPGFAGNGNKQVMITAISKMLGAGLARKIRENKVFYAVDLRGQNTSVIFP
ncbi:hypothetical protein CQA49_06845 [Helicobacter sp. MIT 00-7814]|uniref:hypothetical protein n=1 Tax=unclassified Helicobacter TaxID=2593540 RepID=UPI000E1F5157|nr:MULTISPECIES: hypothetical protein [unclassified Helicobacter]RDU53359.1 hypothetical protein CQA49_06845 [Helicobacter sp. MIT 00-7814]RDU54180.1 hypothetical protein CQA37_06085 [Helicobacter sp. MIT 99-10781]